MALSTADTPQIVQSSLDQAFAQQLQRFRLINEVMGLPELSIRQRIPGNIVRWASEPSVEALNESTDSAVDSATASDMVFEQGTVGYQKYGARTIMSNEIVEDWLAQQVQVSGNSKAPVSKPGTGIDYGVEGPSMFEVMMQSHARGLIKSVNEFMVAQLDAAAGISDNVAAPSYPSLLSAAMAVQNQDSDAKMVCSASAKGVMAAEQATAGASEFFSGFPVESCLGFPAAAASGDAYAFAGDLQSCARASVKIRHLITDQADATALAINDSCELISFAEVWIAVADETRVIKASYV